MKRLLMLLLVLLPLPASAEIYSWTDTAGTAHFTDDLGAVPPQYRKRAVLQNEEALPDAGAPAVTATHQGALAASSQKVPLVGPKGAAAALKAPYGGKSAAAWQVEFRQRREAVQELDRQIKQLKAEVNNPNDVVSSARIAELNVRRTELAHQYEVAARELNTLVEEANRAGLPSEYAK